MDRLEELRGKKSQQQREIIQLQKNSKEMLEVNKYLEIKQEKSESKSNGEEIRIGKRNESEERKKLDHFEEKKERRTAT